MDDWRLGHNDDRALFEALEACRADGDELSDPALEALALRLVADAGLAERLARIQAFDRKIAGALEAIPVPEGVRQRVLARVVAAAATAESSAVVGGTPPVEAGRPSEQVAAPPTSVEAVCHIAPGAASDVRSVPSPSDVSAVVGRRGMQPPSQSRPAPETIAPQPAPPPARRRRWFLVAAPLGAAAAVAVAVWLGSFGGSARDARQVLDEAQQFFLADQPGQGTSLAEAAPPAAWPLSREVAAGSPAVRWRPVEPFLGTKALAYDLPARRGVRATLYVARIRAAGLPDRPPLAPSRNTGGTMIAAWQEGPLLYVLAVEGNASDYRRLLRGPGGPVAWLALQPSKSA